MLSLEERFAVVGSIHDKGFLDCAGNRRVPTMVGKGAKKSLVDSPTGKLGG